ncbi:Vacuolar protein sorting-associated protein 68 [Basidiobolus ranarum]|uniref:Vacuolar protein sorting-associated protein 68 n=1 Tax=Basidiobolus ranarum TaxID=34480 RepID=A0ABR2WRV6_9FUNG
MEEWSESRSPFLCSLPRLPSLGPRKREIGAYSAGILFAAAWWVFIDAIVVASTVHDLPVFIGFEDYVSGIICTIGMIIVNSIDLSILQGENFSYSGAGLAGKARMMLFIGMAAMAGGVAGSVAILCIKYLVPGVSGFYMYFGIAPVVQNVTILVSCAVLWVSQNTESEGHYNFVLN